MTAEQEKAMTSYWRDYLNPRDEDEYFDPPTDYVRGFEDGIRYQSGQTSPHEYHCPYCGRSSFPDYGTCAFCGVR